MKAIENVAGRAIWRRFSISDHESGDLRFCGDRRFGFGDLRFSSQSALQHSCKASRQQVNMTTLEEVYFGLACKSHQDEKR